MTNSRRINRVMYWGASLILLAASLPASGFARGPAGQSQEKNQQQPSAQDSDGTRCDATPSSTRAARSSTSSATAEGSASPTGNAPSGGANITSDGVSVGETRPVNMLDLTAFSIIGKPATGQSQSPTPSKPAQSGQNPDEQQKLDISAITQRLEASPPVGPERAGVNLAQVENLTLQDAIRMALLNNLTIEQSRQAVQISQYSLFSAKGVYDVTSQAQLFFINETIPESDIENGAVNGALTEKLFVYNFNTQQSFERTGGLWQVSFSNTRVDTNSIFSVLSPLYSSTLQFSVTQPLMRNLSVDANRHTIQLAKATLDLSDSQFRQQVIQIINQIQDAYWELAFAIQNEKIARDTYNLTNKQLEDNRKQVEAGTLAPLDLRQTEAQLESNKGTIIAAKQTITTDENNVKILLLKNPNDNLWNSVINPIDNPDFESPTFSLGDAISLALKNRPELEQIRLQALQNKININFFKNQLKPQVDLVAFYNSTGLAGIPTPSGSGESATATASPVAALVATELNPALTNSVLNTFNPAVAAAASATPTNQFNGGYLTDLGQLFSQKFRTFQVGVVLSFPWKNRTAQGNLGQALAQDRQTSALEKIEIQQIQVDVRNALQAVDAARESYEAAVAGRKAAYAQYVGEEEKFRAGLSTTYLVLQQETALATARGTEVRALTNYRQALSDFQRVTGTTLVSNNVDVPSTSQQSGQGQGQTPATPPTSN
jgi:outer membrane protein